MDRNTMKRKLAWTLCVCMLLASAVPAALAESTPGEAQVVTLEENQPKQPVGREKIGMKLTPGNGVVAVALTGTADQGVIVELFASEDDDNPAKQTATFDASGKASVQLSVQESGEYTVLAQYAVLPSNEYAQQTVALTAAASAANSENNNSGAGSTNENVSTGDNENKTGDNENKTGDNENKTGTDDGTGTGTGDSTGTGTGDNTGTGTGDGNVEVITPSDNGGSNTGDSSVVEPITPPSTGGDSGNNGNTGDNGNAGNTGDNGSGNPGDGSTQITANAFTVGLYPGEGTLDVDVYGGSEMELTVTLTKPDGSTETKTIQNGGGIVTFDNLTTGTYKVKVDYTTPAVNVQAYTGTADVTAAGEPAPDPAKIEATASVNGQSILVTITNAEDKDIDAKLVDADGKTAATGKIVMGQATFADLAAGTYTVELSYSDGSAGSKTISGLTVEKKNDVQAITATAAAGVKRIDVEVTAASPLKVAVSLMQNGAIKDTREIEAGVGKVSFENLAAGTYSVSIDYAPSQPGVAAKVIENLNVTEENVKIAISGVTPGENKLTVSGTAKPNERITISTVPDGGSVIVTAGADGKFTAELARTAGTYTAVSAQYVSDESSRVTLEGLFVVTGTVAKPALEVDDLYNNSLTVVAKTTAGVTVYLKTGDYEQTLVADSRGIVRFTLPHTYAQGTRFTLTVYYGAGNTLSYNVDVTVGGMPYYKLFKRGSRGDGVYALTSRLSELGYPVSPTNSYSDSVVAAVRLFQVANGLSADGMAGKLTQEKLYSVSAIGYNESGATYPTLVRGDRGMALIYTLQQRLKDLGYYTIRVDGIFGSGTQRAVRWFQSVNGLSVTGKADDATQQLLYSSQAKAASGYSPDSYDTLSRSNRYNAAVAPLQRRLKALGYLSGSADGYFGSNTYRAVRSFQSRNGLSVTGVADPGTQQLLYSSSARPAAGSSSSGSSTSTGYRLLYWGCKGDAVKKLQQALIDAGYKSYVRTADGIYGKWTYDAVRAYQKDVGLSVDGIAGKNTQNKLYGTNY